MDDEQKPEPNVNEMWNIFVDEDTRKRIGHKMFHTYLLPLYKECGVTDSEALFKELVKFQDGVDTAIQEALEGARCEEIPYDNPTTIQ